jgi:hypothetical protein
MTSSSLRRMETGTSRICPGNAFFTTDSGAQSTTIGLRVVGFIRSSSVRQRERHFSIHIAHITRSFN